MYFSSKTTFFALLKNVFLNETSSVTWEVSHLHCLFINRDIYIIPTTGLSSMTCNNITTHGMFSMKISIMVCEQPALQQLTCPGKCTQHFRSPVLPMELRCSHILLTVNLGLAVFSLQLKTHKMWIWHNFSVTGWDFPAKANCHPPSVPARS